MLDIRLIASDIDGTIIPFGGTISQATIDIINECAEKGIMFALASGRCYPEAAKVAKAVGIRTPIICANGACVHDADGNILHEEVLTPEESEIAFNIIKDCGWMVNSYVRGKVIRLGTELMKVGGPQEKKIVYKDIDFEFIDDDPARMEAEGRERVYKYEVYSRDKALLRRLTEELTEAGLSVSSSVPTDIEIMSRNAGKGSTVKWLANHIGATHEQTMAFGDNTNDLQMLASVAWPVAMENAVEELKAAARIIAPHCAENGVAKTIAKYVFGREE